MRHLNSIYDNYNGIAKFLHWMIALLIIVNYIMGLTLDSTQWYTIHKQIGLTILLLVFLRVLWRLTSKYPAKLANIAAGEQFAAVGGQVLLYALMLAIPLSGILMTQSYGYPLSLWGIIPIPTLIAKAPHETTHLINQWHEWMAHAIIIIAAGHGLIALVHHYLLKDRLLRRMLPSSCNKHEAKNS